MLHAHVTRKSEWAAFAPAAESLESRRLLAAAPVVLTTLSNAAESGPTTGLFRVGRVGEDRSSPLTVTLRVGGTAAYGSDYTLPTTPADGKIQVTIPAGEGGKAVQVVPIDDVLVEGPETVTVTLVAPAGTTYDPTPAAGLTIADNDAEPPAAAPVAHANGPYNVIEGKQETLHGTATAPAGRSVQAYQWDFNYDGVTFDVDATGANPVFSAAAIDGIQPGTVRNIALRVIDSANVVSAVSTSTVTIKNAAPTAKLTGSAVTIGQSGTVTFSDIKDVPADVAAGFTFRYDFDNDGIFDLTSNSPSAVVPAAYLTTAGPHTVRASIRDKDDGTSVYTTTVTVKNVEPVQTATLKGFAFNDNNVNGLYDAGDGPSHGAIVFLDANENGVLDAGEPYKAAEANGKFSFINLAPGTYHVRRVFDATRTYSTPLIDVTLAPGQTRENLLIGAKHTGLTPVQAAGSFAGEAFADKNRDRLNDVLD